MGRDHWAATVGMGKGRGGGEGTGGQRGSNVVVTPTSALGEHSLGMTSDPEEIIGSDISRSGSRLPICNYSSLSATPFHSCLSGSIILLILCLLL